MVVSQFVCNNHESWRCDQLSGAHGWLQLRGRKHLTVTLQAENTAAAPARDLFATGTGF